MAVSLTTRIGVIASRTFTNRDVTAGPMADDSNSWVLQAALAYGTGVDEANTVFHTIENLATGASVLFDMSGTLTDAFGTTITLSKVKLVAVVHQGIVGTLTVGGGSNAMTSFWATAGDCLTVQPDGGIMLFAPDATGYAVTASTAENIRVLHNGDTAQDIQFEIIVIGVA